MNRSRILRVVLGACLCLVGAAAGGLPSPPPIAADEGRALVALARDAMLRYLTHRVGPETVPIPPGLSALRRQKAPVAITLRRAGAVVALEVETGADICRNAVAAALRAMRSSRLPDRIDRNVLESLTVEVDVLSEPMPVEPGRLGELFVPGLTGIAYGRRTPATRPAADGHQRAWVLPAAGYVLGLDADSMRRAAMGRFRLTPANASLPGRLEVFTTRHFVQVPGGEPLELYRGKDLSRRGVGPAEFPAAAETVGRFLAARQLPDGRYAAARPAALRDHLHAAWAMTKLARRRPAAGFAASAARAVRFALDRLETVPSGERLPPEGPGDGLAETALLALACADAADPELSARAKPIARRLSSRLKAVAHPAPAGAFIALLALERTGQDTAAIREALAEPAADPAALAWAFRAGATDAVLSPPGRDGRRAGLRQFGPEGLPDEIGGIGPAPEGPRTVLTGLVAAGWARRLRRSGGLPAANAARLRARLIAAGRFCHAMIYQGGEACFAPEPSRWVGAVRAAPERAEATVSACAAAIEALLFAASAAPAGTAPPE